MSPEVAVALVSGAFAILVALIEKSRRDNNRDHGDTSRKLDRIEDKIDGHIGDHARRDLN